MGSGLRGGWVARTGALVLAWSAASGPAAAQGWHEDARFGFKLLPPRGWKPIPLKASESWLVAKYLSDQKDHWTDKEDGWTWEHQPELMVIAFVDEAIQKAKKAAEEAEARARAEEEKEKKEKEKEKAGGGEGGGDDGGDEDEPEAVVVQRPFEDYEDYLDRTYEGGGFYVAEREEGVEGTLPVTKLAIKVEKLTYTGPKRIVAWVFHAEGVDLAVQAEMLEDSFPKLEATILRTLRSFRPIPRTMGPLPTDLRADASEFISLASMSKGTPEERRQKRLESEQRLHARAKKALPAGWQVLERERALVLYATDAGFAGKVADGLEVLLDWAETNLGFIGPDTYVRRPIVRVCATAEEMESLQRGVRGSDSWVVDLGNEIVTCKDKYGATGWQADWLNRQLLDLWLRERDGDVWLGMPEWVQHGLYEYVSGARLSGRKLEFKDYQDEVRNFRRTVQEKKNIPVRELVQMTAAQFYGADANYAGYWNRLAQADMVVRFLLSGDAARSKQTKTLLFDYLKNLDAVVAELLAEDLKSSGPEKEPTSEEEEEELYKKKHAAWGASERETQVVERTFRRTFGAWSPGDWQAFEKAFLKYAD
jgi:hypothetical protein